MKLLPYEHFKITTHLGGDEAVRKLEDAIQPRRLIKFVGTSQKPYEGEFDGSHFEVTRIIGYSNSFLPLIKGDLGLNNGGCSISVSMRPHALVIAFMSLILIQLGFLFLALLISFVSSLVRTEAADPIPFLGVGGMFALVYALFFGGFKSEAVKSKEFFQELFAVDQVEELP